jgi:cell division protein FtsQ
MARRPEAQRPAVPPSRRRDPEQPSAFDSIRWGRLVAWIILGMIVLVGTLFAWHRTEEFLIRDDRFRLKEPLDFAGQSPSLVVEGIRYASPAQIRHVFAPDFGRSLYLVPISQRRHQLMAIDWVEEATVSKIWPNTLKVHIQERSPIAFVHLPPNRKNGMSEFALIDKDGFILRPKIAAKFRLPVVNGVRESEEQEDRSARVHRVLAMIQELGSKGDRISEIDVSDPNNLIVAEHVDDRVVNLMLGEENYLSRMSNFLSNYNEIKAKRPDATTFDLRVDNMITVVGDAKHGQ